MLEQQPPDPAMFSGLSACPCVRLGLGGACGCGRELSGVVPERPLLVGGVLAALAIAGWLFWPAKKRGFGGFAAVKISKKDPADMSASAINRELDAIDKKRSALADRFIEAGRGHETATEIHKQSDPLSQDDKALSDRRTALQVEIHRRAGPGTYRMPKGFGPRKDRW